MEAPIEETPLPNIQVLIPKSSFPGASRDELIRGLTRAAAEAERMPEDPRRHFYCWVQLIEVDAFACGGADVSARMLPCVATVRVPAGVLDAAGRDRYARQVHEALEAALPAGESRQLASSVLVEDVADGTWAANGKLWRLPDFAEAAGYGHLAELRS